MPAARAKPKSDEPEGLPEGVDLAANKLPSAPVEKAGDEEQSDVVVVPHCKGCGRIEQPGETEFLCPRCAWPRY